MMYPLGFSLLLTIFYLLLETGSYCQQISALRLGRDSQKNDMAIVFSNHTYYVLFKLSFEYEKSDFTFCFRQRPVLDKSDTECELGNATGPFDCISYNYFSSLNKKWTMNSDYSFNEDQVQIHSFCISCSIVNYKNSFSLGGILNYNQIGPEYFSFITKQNTFYEVLSATSASVFQNQPQNVKKNFFSNFYQNDPLFRTTSGNLLMPRQAVCFRHNQIYHVLFLGGVVRDSKSIYMQALVSYDNKKKKFKMWAGLSYSSSHASRDMVGIDQMFGTVGDLFSLYASAPFQDTSNAIKGNSNYVMIANSGQQSSTSYWVYYIQFYRSMQTEDTKGDEIIRFKINNKYCFVSYSEYSQQSFTAKDAKMFLNKNYMHQYSQCFTPDLTLDESRPLFNIWALGFFLILFILL